MAKRTAIAGFLRRLRGDRRGGALMICGFAILPLVFATGMGVDYARAMRLQTKLAAAADAAALAAVSRSVMSWNSATAALAAQQMFITQTSGLYGLVINYNDPTQFKVTVNDTNGSSNVRTATVTFRGQSKNSFAGVLGIKTLTIKGTSASSASTAPNIDFYLMLDTSGSMALPTTSAGLSQLTSLTGGCAFACHSTNDAKATAKDGTQQDYYGVAKSYGITLRVDEETTATQNLMTTATSTEGQNHASYRMSVSTFAAANTFRTIAPLTTNLSQAATQAGSASVSLYYTNNCPTSSVCNNDTDTATNDAFTKINTLMPNPGNGTNQGNDTPQEIMFIVTDGMRDEFRSSGGPEGGIDTSFCSTIKNRGIRIAVLYTEYLPQSFTDGWSQTYAAPVQPSIEPALQTCASSGLYYKVTTNDDISAALNALFQKAVATAHLTQ
ncbi:MAG: hypothetical protein JOY99_04025 [Sphingomonadaceae bacterium]|nr:hypothetical protein [Sphingomonadaceae bacterium]